MSAIPITTSLIGSFRKHFGAIRAVMAQFEQAGIHVLSPKPSDVIDPRVEFVILASDNPMHTEEEIELIALHRILRSSFVYTYNPNGYIGRTTCYEIGRLVERKVPVFFQEKPHDFCTFRNSLCHTELQLYFSCIFLRGPV